MDKDPKSGKFCKGNRGGPGRGKVAVAMDAFKRATIQETAKALAEAIPELESRLTELDAAIAAAEDAFLEKLGPTLKRRAQTECDLSRARVAQHYVSDPLGFAGLVEPPADAAMREHSEIVRALEDAQRELDDNPEPTGHTRTECLADADRWAKLRRFEQARDRHAELTGFEYAARRKAEGFGHTVPLLKPGPTLDNESDPFAPPKRRRSRMEMVRV